MIQESLQPKIKTVVGKRLKDFKDVAPNEPYGQKDFFAGLFQVVKKFGGEIDAGKLKNMSDEDNLQPKDIASAAAIKKEDWERFEAIYNEFVTEFENETDE